jgi:hypothetical protein
VDKQQDKQQGKQQNKISPEVDLTPNFIIVF